MSTCQAGWSVGAKSRRTKQGEASQRAKSWVCKNRDIDAASFADEIFSYLTWKMYAYFNVIKGFEVMRPWGQEVLYILVEIQTREIFLLFRFLEIIAIFGKVFTILCYRSLEVEQDLYLRRIAFQWVHKITCTLEGCVRCSQSTSSEEK